MRLSTEIYTPYVAACRDFYVRYFGFRVQQELTGFAVLRPPESDAVDLLFCEPYSEFVQSVFHRPFTGEGVLLQLEVEDVAAEYHRLQQLGAPFALTLVEEPFNGQHFTVRDPAGLLVDVVQAVREVT
ncbi:VOC family protein [Hymenobacter terrenus]|uniref:VOC family protein n=1 Tax=Hymenobacter terrenus TaxID=1629124 RepID=UPI00061985A3|nr:VOC family protein [Hymenobacter terrenus]